MIESLVPIMIMLGMFTMIFGIVYIRSRENMALIERGLNPRNAKATPRPFISLKYGLLFMGAGMGLLLAYIADHTILDNVKHPSNQNISIGGHHNIHKKAIVSLADSMHRDTTVGAGVAVTISDNTPGDDSEETHSIVEIKSDGPENVPVYFALIAIGGGLGLFLSYKIEKRELLDKKIDA